MEMTEWAELIVEAEDAYTDARHWVFDRQGWTAQALLTSEQTACLARLNQAEKAIHDHRQRGAAVAERRSPQPSV
jgi:hypothetical protein